MSKEIYFSWKTSKPQLIALFPAVRYGRVPKRSREFCGNADSQSHYLTTPTTPPVAITSTVDFNNAKTDLLAVPEEEDLDSVAVVEDVISIVSQSHKSFCSYSDDLIQSLNRRPIASLLLDRIREECENPDSVQNQKIWLWQQYALRITPSVQRVVEFAKRIPEFCDFVQDDQLILIKMGFFEVWINHVARTVTETMFVFDDGYFFTKKQLEIMYDVSIFQYF